MTVMSRRRVIAGMGAAISPLLGRRVGAAAEPVRCLLWWDYITRETIDQFRAATGDDLFARGIGANDEIFTFLRAAPGRYSVVSPHQGLIRGLLDVGLLQPIDPAKLPHLAEVEPRFDGDRWFAIDGQRYGVPLVYGSSPLVTSAKTLPTPPAAWEELRSKAYRGKLGMMDDGLGHLFHWSAALGYPDPSVLSLEDLAEVTAALVALKRDQVRIFTTSVGELAAGLASGELLAATTGWAGMPLLPEAAEGELGLSHPAPRDYGFVHALCIPAGAPDVDGAHRVIDFLLRADQQAALAARVKRGVVNLGALPLLDAMVAPYVGYPDLDATLAASPITAFPPLTGRDEGKATYVDWVNAWERVRLTASKNAPKDE